MKQSYRSTLSAADLMNADTVTVGPADTIKKAAHRLVEKHVSGLPVIDAQGRCLGVISATDIMRFIDGAASKREPETTRFTKFFDHQTHRWEYLDLTTFFSDELGATEVAEVMTRDPLYVRPWTPIQEVAELMRSHEVHRILVLGEGHYLKGILSAMDFVRLAAAMECEAVAGV